MVIFLYQNEMFVYDLKKPRDRLLKSLRQNHLTHRNHSIKCLIVGIVCSCSVLIQGCATGSHSNAMYSNLKPIENPGPVTIELKGKKGDTVKTRFYSHSLTKNFHQSQIIKKKDEIVEFSLVEEIRQSDSKKDRIIVLATSKEKDGVVDLHDLAFPELDETIEYVYTSKGKVIKAGEYPQWSIFYVPPLPLPEVPVQVGDTWEMKEEWRSMNNGIPLQVNLVGILKNVYQCGADRCADIEMSGDVSLANATAVDINFVSEMNGRLLFNIDKGVSVWSMIQGQEDLRTNDDQTIVLSCLASNVLQPDGVVLQQNPVTQCQPTGEPIKIQP